MTVPPNPGHIDLNSMIVTGGYTNFLGGLFDSSWTVPPDEEVAVTSFAQGSETEAQKPTILLNGNILYVAYVPGPIGDLAAAQVSVARFRLWPDRRPHRFLHRVPGDE